MLNELDKKPPLGGGGRARGPPPAPMAQPGGAGEAYRLRPGLWPPGGGGGGAGPALCRALSRDRKSLDCFDSAITAKRFPPALLLLLLLLLLLF